MARVAPNCRVCERLLSLAIASICFCWHPHVQAQDQSTPGAIEQQLLARVQSDPRSSSSWRMLGRIRLARGDVAGALQAEQTAVELDPNCVSAHFDLAQAYLAGNQTDQAAEHFFLAQAIAPQSDYGIAACEQLDRIGWPAQPPFTALGETDAQPNRFSGAPINKLTGTEKKTLAIQLEIGADYNSNVQLAPISRVIAAPGLASAQAFLAPELEWRFASGPDWSLGTHFQSYFNVNEGAFSEFNLQEYRPGVYWERSFLQHESDLVARLQYDFILDQFSGSTFATRHAWTGTLSRLEDTRETLAYWSIDLSNFADDGIVPSMNSLDGWTHTIGASRTWFRDRGLFSLVRGGADAQWAPLEGNDFAYRGVFAYVESEMPTYSDCTLAVQLGGGYRQYPDFSGSPSRNEHLYRARIELRKALSDRCDIVAMASYDRFACENDAYDTSRFLSGIVTILRY